MNMHARYDGLKVPAWSLCYLVNGDPGDLDEKELKQVDSWYFQFVEEAKKVNGSVIFSVDEDEAHFCHNPEFGLAADVENCTVLIVY